VSTAILRVAFYRPGTEDRGEMTFQGDPAFISESAHAVSSMISHLNATYGGDKDNWVKTGNELMAAWEAVKQGKGFEGEIVSVTITE
jgi:hypothetical protein